MKILIGLMVAEQIQDVALFQGVPYRETAPKKKLMFFFFSDQDFSNKIYLSDMLSCTMEHTLKQSSNKVMAG